MRAIRGAGPETTASRERGTVCKTLRDATGDGAHQRTGDRPARREFRAARRLLCLGEGRASARRTHTPVPRPAQARPSARGDARYRMGCVRRLRLCHRSRGSAGAAVSMTWGLSSGCSRAHAVGLRTGGATARTRCLRLRLRATGRLRWRLGCRVGASLRGSEGLLGLLTRFVLDRHVGQRWRLGCRLSASLRRSEVLLGLLTRFVSIRHVGQGRPGLPEAHEPSAGQQRAGTGIRAGHSERGSRRSGAARKQQDQRGRAGSRSEHSEQGASAHHGDSGAGLACSSGQFAPRSIHLLAG